MGLGCYLTKMHYVSLGTKRNITKEKEKHPQDLEEEEGGQREQGCKSQATPCARAPRPRAQLTLCARAHQDGRLKLLFWASTPPFAPCLYISYLGPCLGSANTYVRYLRALFLLPLHWRSRPLRRGSTCGFQDLLLEKTIIIKTSSLRSG